jgi:hypothetical protein
VQTSYPEFVRFLYFKWVWVMQEIMYPSKAYVIYGKAAAEYHQSYKIGDRVWEHAAKSCLWPLNQNPILRPSRAKINISLAPWKRVRLYAEILCPLIHGRTTVVDRECFDPRDKRFTFYGCVHQWSETA